MNKRLAILGSTGSIGVSTIRVIEHAAGRFQVTGLAAGQRTDDLSAQARALRPAWVYAENHTALKQAALPPGCRIMATQEALCEAVGADDVDIVVCAIVGTAGLKPVLAAIAAGKDIALASKEVLVMAGGLVTAAAAASGSRILPVDSEHCAIFQCLDGHEHTAVSRVILTASGGPFRRLPAGEFSRVSLAQALAHPTWNMGRKITIDSATMMNKGLEMLEAGWLFGMPSGQVDVVIHPQSIIHSMVEFRDGSIIAQMGYPDMALPIHYCLNYPERQPSPVRRMDFKETLRLDFEPPDPQRFPALDLARLAMREGRAMGAVFNAANEVAVERFCREEVTFNRIPDIVAIVMRQLGGKTSADSLDDILAADAEARRLARLA